MRRATRIPSRRRRKPRSAPEDYPRMLAEQCRLVGLPAPDREVRFHPTRRWRADLLWRHERLMVEVEGGGFVGGRHGRGVGMEKDCEKYAEATCAGYVVLRVTPRQVRDGVALAWVQRCLERAGEGTVDRR